MGAPFLKHPDWSLLQKGPPPAALLVLRDSQQAHASRLGLQEK